jgi:hypothetical protein
MGDVLCRYGASHAVANNAKDNLLYEETRKRDSEEQELQSYRDSVRRSSRHNFILQGVRQLQ